MSSPEPEEDVNPSLPPSPLYSEKAFGLEDTVSPASSQSLNPDDEGSKPPAFTDKTVRGVPPLNTTQAYRDDGSDNYVKSAHAENGKRHQKTHAHVAELEDFQLIRVVGTGCAGRAISKRSVFTHDEMHHTLTELSILKRFAIEEPDNPFVSKLVYSFTDKENFYFVMEFYPGGDLATQMEINHVLGDHRTRFYAADITQGLEDLHRHGIIVRDLKPENILLNAHGHAVLADFGLSKAFPYRGEPKPIHVVTYWGQPVLPYWAGAGAGSVRTVAGVQQRVEIDKAYSFVGTTEYIAPEVVRRGEYSYAVDWWGLGCIIVEGLTGKVPFRKREDESHTVLYERILYTPWDEMFDDPRYARYRPDQMTLSFIDGLLQKDPMWRLTEPCVKQHGYFSMIDWDTVGRGEYEDPYGLEIDPMAEYNTRYFPKLCLDESPSVDMSNHDHRDYEDMLQRTPLNDNQLYALEQAKYKAELSQFAWSREEEYGTESEADVHNQDEASVELEEETIVSVAPLTTSSPSSILTRDPALLRNQDESAHSKTLQTPNERHKLVEQHQAGLSADLKEINTITVADTVNIEDDHKGIVPDRHSNDVSVVDLEEQSLFVPETTTLSSSSSVDELIDTLRDKETSDDPIPDKIISQGDIAEEQPRPSLPPLLSRPSEPIVPSKQSSHLPPLPSPTHSDQGPENSSPLPPPGSPMTSRVPPVLHYPIPIKVQNGLQPRLSHETGVPLGLPSSGLSVSDIVSVPSPGIDLPARLIRRRPRLPSDDTIPIARLSVELNGTITNLEDDDWEQLEAEGPDASAPNGPTYSKGSIFARLRRRSSMLGGSGLRRQTKNSDSSSRSSHSPTKQRPPLFAGKGIENTRKVFGKLKTFPILKGIASELGNHQKESKPSLRGISPLSAQAGIEHGDGNGGRPWNVRRHTESNWFEKKVKRGKASSSVPASVSGRSSKASVSSSGSVLQGDGSTGKGEAAPRLELKETPAIVWELEKEDWGVKE
nr:uncharacterized protein CI109_004783 [Kwoniella shandongensis]KAA5526783.1 hypothetical protein CI109_004783 [Kwoniella shandongensis]